MKKFEYTIPIFAETTEEAKEKAKCFHALSKKLTGAQMVATTETIVANPKIIPFMEKIAKEYNIKEVGFLDFMSIAKRAFTELK